MHCSGSFLLIFILILARVPANSQYDNNKSKVFTSLEEALDADKTRVYFLDLKQQELKYFPKEILSFEHLIHLNLAHNQLSNLHGIDLSGLKDLEEIILYDNEFKVFPYDALDSAPNLQIIDLGQNEISELGTALNSLRFLEKLDLSNNRILTIAKDIKLPYLRTITLERNYLSAIPDFVFESSKLTSLNLFGNTISSIPATMNQLSKLEILNIGDNPITFISEDIKLRRLEKLILDWIDLSANNSALQFIESSTLLKSLSLEHCNLEAVPKPVFTLKRLQELSLLHNEIYSLPKALRQQKRLKKVWIGGTMIEDFGTEN